MILRWLAEQFEHGVRYPEAQVNAILKRYHPDSATLLGLHNRTCPLLDHIDHVFYTHSRQPKLPRIASLNTAGASFGSLELNHGEE